MATIVLGSLTVGLVLLAVFLESRASRSSKAAALHLRERDEARAAEAAATRRAENAEKKLPGLQKERDELARTIDENKAALQRATQDAKRFEREVRKVRDDAADSIAAAAHYEAELRALQKDAAGSGDEKRRLLEQVAAKDAALKDAERREVELKRAAERPVERPVERAPRPEPTGDATRQAELEAENGALRGKFGDLKRRTAMAVAELRRYRGAYESHLRAYRLLKAEVDLLEAEVTYLRYGEDGYPEAPVRVDDELDDGPAAADGPAPEAVAEAAPQAAPEAIVEAAPIEAPPAPERVAEPVPEPEVPVA
jgi:chromosome segregation ATPase